MILNKINNFKSQKWEDWFLNKNININIKINIKIESALLTV